MREHQHLDPCGLRNPPGVLGRGVVGHDALLQGRGIGDAGDQAIEPRQIEHFVDEDIGALSKSNQIVARRGVPRNDDRAVRRIEAIPERRYDRRMMHERRRHLDVLILHHRPAFA